MRYLLKIVITAIVIAGVSEAGKRLPLLAAILASLPLTSFLAMLWLYADTGDQQKIISLSYGIFWAVLPSLLFFLLLPYLLKHGVRFSWAMCITVLGTSLSYALYVWLLKKFGITF